MDCIVYAYKYSFSIAELTFYYYFSKSYCIQQGIMPADAMPDAERALAKQYLQGVYEKVGATSQNEIEEVQFATLGKLYVFQQDAWKEKGMGLARLSKTKQSGMIRFIMQDQQTEKVLANHYVIVNPPFGELTMNAGNPKSYVWTAIDNTDGVEHIEQFALRLQTPEIGQDFFKAWAKSWEHNKPIHDQQQESTSAQKSDSDEVSAQKPAPRRRSAFKRNRKYRK